ncbi:hypothetical protein GQR58_014261 [Nymphon striatum]|nr:hypothetical protein GQR58_014261 [Nymphon striatum]
MHVRVAWEIHSHQTRQQADLSKGNPAAKGADPLLRPPTSGHTRNPFDGGGHPGLFMSPNTSPLDMYYTISELEKSKSSLDHEYLNNNTQVAMDTSLSEIMRMFNFPLEVICIMLLYTSLSSFPRPGFPMGMPGNSSFGGLGSLGGGLLGGNRDIQGFNAGMEHWNRLLRTPTSFPTPPPHSWHMKNAESLNSSERDRQQQREESERDRLQQREESEREKGRENNLRKPTPNNISNGEKDRKDLPKSRDFYDRIKDLETDREKDGDTNVDHIRYLEFDIADWEGYAQDQNKRSVDPTLKNVGLLNSKALMSELHVSSPTKAVLVTILWLAVIIIKTDRLSLYVIFQLKMTFKKYILLDRESRQMNSIGNSLSNDIHLKGFQKNGLSDQIIHERQSRDRERERTRDASRSPIRNNLVRDHELSMKSSRNEILNPPPPIKTDSAFENMKKLPSSSNNNSNCDSKTIRNAVNSSTKIIPNPVRTSTTPDIHKVKLEHKDDDITALPTQRNESHSSLNTLPLSTDSSSSSNDMINHKLQNHGDSSSSRLNDHHTKDMFMQRPPTSMNVQSAQSMNLVNMLDRARMLGPLGLRVPPPHGLGPAPTPDRSHPLAIWDLYRSSLELSSMRLDQLRDLSEREREQHDREFMHRFSSPLTAAASGAGPMMLPHGGFPPRFRQDMDSATIMREYERERLAAIERSKQVHTNLRPNDPGFMNSSLLPPNRHSANSPLVNSHGVGGKSNSPLANSLAMGAGPPPLIPSGGQSHNSHSQRPSPITNMLQKYSNSPNVENSMKDKKKILLQRDENDAAGLKFINIVFRLGKEDIIDSEETPSTLQKISAIRRRVWWWLEMKVIEMTVTEFTKAFFINWQLPQTRDKAMVRIRFTRLVDESLVPPQATSSIQSLKTVSNRQ